MKITAVIFDLNGTVLDDEDTYGQAFNKVLKTLGIDSITDQPHIKGIGVKENWPILIEKYNIKTSKTPAQLAQETQEAYFSELSVSSVRPGFEEFLDALKESGIRVCLATSNTWEAADRILEKVDLVGAFDEITTSDEVKYNKPDPEIFTLSADKLGVERYECLVIEDAVAGIEAAHRAGMKVICISEDDEDEAKLSSADLVVQGFSEITPRAIDEL